MGKVASFLITFYLIALASQVHAQAIAKPALATAFASGAFAENKGQWDSHARFMAKSGNLDMWITDSGPVLNLKSGKAGQVVRLQLLNARGGRAGFSPSTKLTPEANYFIGNDRSKWATHVREYAEVKDDLGKGLSVRYYFENGRPRYDLIVQPGADPSSLAYKISGADRLTLTKSGTLDISTSAGTIEEKGLLAYQKSNGVKERVACNMVLKGSTLSFKTGSYDRSKTLVIDPLVFSTYFGSAANTNLTKLRLDSKGNIWVAGVTRSTSYPATEGAYETQVPAGSKGTLFNVIAKLSNDGSQLLTCTFLDGSGRDQLSDLALDSAGEPVVVGGTTSADFPITNNAYQTKLSSPGGDGFVSRLSSDGSQLLYSTFLGGTAINGNAPGPSEALGVCINPSGNAVVVGGTSSKTFPTTSNAYQTALAGSGNAFIAILSLSGPALEGSTYFGSSGGNIGRVCKIDPEGNIVVGGTSNPKGAPTTSSAYQKTYTGEIVTDFVAKLSPDLRSNLECTYLGGAIEDAMGDMAIANDGSVVIVGLTDSGNYPVTSGAYKGQGPTSIQDIAAFASKLSPDLSTLTWSCFLCDDGSASAVALDYEMNPVIVGTGEMATTYEAFEPASRGGFAFITKLSEDGSKLVYSTRFGGSTTNDGLAGLAMDDLDNAYVAGSAVSLDLPITPGAYLPLPPGPYQYSQNGLGSIQAGLVAKINLLVNTMAVTYTSSSVLGGGSVTGTVSLAKAAPSGGQVVDLTVSGAVITPLGTSYPETTPATVTVPAGKTFADFTASTTPVWADSQTIVTATSNGSSASSAPFTIKSAVPVSLTFSQNSVPGGTTVPLTATVTMSGPLPSGDNISLGSNSSAAYASPSVVTGSKVVTFHLDTLPVSTSTVVTFTAGAANQSTITGTLTVVPAALSSLTAQQSTIAQNMSETGTILLNGRAPSGGAKVTLSSSNPSEVGVPGFETISADSLSTTFPITAGTITANGTVTITATYGSSTATLSLTLSAVPLPVSLAPSEAQIVGGSAATATLTMSSNVASKTSGTVTNSDPSILSAGTSVAVNSGTKTGLLSIKTLGVSVPTNVTISVTINGQTVQTQVTVENASLSAVTTAASSVVGGSSTTGTLQLNGDSPYGGIMVSVQSSDPSVQVPASVTLSKYQSSTVFNITTTQVPKVKTVTITASFNGISKTVTLQVTP